MQETGTDGRHGRLSLSDWRKISRAGKFPSWPALLRGSSIELQNLHVWYGGRSRARNLSRHSATATGVAGVSSGCAAAAGRRRNILD